MDGDGTAGAPHAPRAGHRRWAVRGLQGLAVALVSAGLAVATSSSAHADDAAPPPMTSLVHGLADVTTGASELAGQIVQPIAAEVVEPLVTTVVAPVTTPVVQPVLEPVVREVVVPVTEPVADVVAPVVTEVVVPVAGPVVTDVVDPLVSTVVAPVLDPVVTEVVAPVVGALDPVIAPVVDALDPVVAPIVEPLQPLLPDAPTVPGTEPSADPALPGQSTPDDGSSVVTLTASPTDTAAATRVEPTRSLRVGVAVPSLALLTDVVPTSVHATGTAPSGAGADAPSAPPSPAAPGAPSSATAAPTRVPWGDDAWLSGLDHHLAPALRTPAASTAPRQQLLAADIAVAPD